MTSDRLLNMSIKFYTSPKNFIPPKQISGYAPGEHPPVFRWNRTRVGYGKVAVQSTKVVIFLKRGKIERKLLLSCLPMSTLLLYKELSATLRSARCYRSKFTAASRGFPAIARLSCSLFTTSDNLHRQFPHSSVTTHLHVELISHSMHDID